MFLVYTTDMNFMNIKLVRSLVYIFITTAPLIFWHTGVFPHISSKTLYVYGFLSFIIPLWIYAVAVDTTARISSRVLTFFIPLFAYVGWLTIAGLFAENPSLAFWSSFARGTGLLTYYYALGFALVIASLVQKYGMLFVVSFFKYFILGAVLLAGSVWLGPEGFDVAWRALKTSSGGGLMGNSSLTAIYTTFALAMSFFLIASRTLTKRGMWMTYLAIGIILFSPLFINLLGLWNGQGILGTARASVLVIPVLLGATGVFYLLFSSKKTTRIIGGSILALSLVVFGIVWSSLVTPTSSLHQRFTEEARGSRFIFWNVAEKAINEKPILGYGPENYMIAFQKYFDPEILQSWNSMEGWTDRTHNIYYELGVNGGYPLILIYVIFITGLLYTLYLLVRKGTLTQLQGSVLSAFLVGYVFQNLFIFDSTLSIVGLFVLASIIYSLRNDTPQIQTKNMPQIIHQPLIALTVCVIGIVAFSLFAYGPAQKSKLYALTFSGTIAERPAYYPKLLKGSRMGEDWDIGGLAYDAYREYAESAVVYRTDPKILPYILKDLTSILAYLDEVALENTTDNRLAMTRVYLYNTLLYFSPNPDPLLMNQIISIIGESQKLSPTNPNSYWSLAQVRVWQGDFTGAEKAYKDAVALDPYLPASHRLLVQFAKIIGNERLYQESLADAKKYLPEFTEK